MATIGKRHPGYKAGLLVFVMGVAAFVTGFATPHWLKFDVQISPSAVNHIHRPGRELQGHTGLWSVCVKTLGSDFICQDPESSTDWVLAVKVLDCIAIGVIALSACFFVFTNCLTQTITFTRHLEIGTGLSGLLGIIGAAVYMWKSHTDTDFISVSLQDYDTDLNLSWSYHANVGGSVVILVATVLIAIYNRPIHPKRAAATTTLGQRHPSSGSNRNPYVVSDAMSGRIPRLYPDLETVREESDKPVTIYLPTTEMRY